VSDAVRFAIALTTALAALFALARGSDAQVYGYTDDNGVLILSNVPTTDRMRLIVDDSAQPAGSAWHYSGQYDPLILRASNLFGVDSSLVRAVIAVESAFNRYARSHKGARGLMQLMPDTGRRYGLVNAYDPWQNIRAGTAHLRDLMDEFKDLRLALAAYNAGPTPVRRHGGIPPYTETRNYVRKVMAIYGAGSKVQIVKGNRVYTIGQPGARTQVTTTDAPSGGGSPLAELARRAAASRRPAAALEALAPPPPPAPMVDSDPGPDVYYRFIDPEGTVVITRSRPASFPYDVLQP
jgi:soluble lytic murein transglycosylase